jgi:uncharacterized membrane protein YkvA (DUF1232 family)
MFDENGFWSYLKKVFKKITFFEDILTLYYCMMDEDTPVAIKATIAAALVYFVSPIDAIPDFTPFVGFLDDAGVIAAALAAVMAYIKDEHRQKSKNWRW